MARYQKPGWFVSRVANSVVEFVIGRFGMSPMGAQLLEVRGRTSGKVQTVPVNPIMVDGNRFLVAPRGETQWVRNFRVAGKGALKVGDERELIHGGEVPDGAKPRILHAYLDKYYGQVGSQFCVPKDASLEQLAEIAGSHPVFQIHAQEIASEESGF